MITINTKDFAGLQPAERAQYRAAVNFLFRATKTDNLAEKKRLLNNALYHLQEVNDVERVKLLKDEIASFES